MENPVLFLSLTIMVFTVLTLCKRHYVLNFFAFWLSVNVSYITEPVSSGADNVLNLMLFLSIPISSSPLLKRWITFQPIFYNVSVLLIQIHIALIYLLSGYNKLTSSIWRSGQAIGYIGSLDFFADPIVTNYQSTTLNFLVSWFVIGFEIVFPLFIWFRNYRIYLLAIGTVMHLGIMYFLNLPDFGLLMILSYAIFLKPGSNSKSLQERD
jgi:hypothetical protein